jgi:hypothetical protein
MANAGAGCIMRFHFTFFGFCTSQQRMKKLLALAFLAALPVWAQEVANTNRATELKADARLDAATIASLPEGAAVTVLGRFSSWTKVQSAEQKTGWVRAFHLRFKSTVSESSSGSSPIGGMLGGLFGGNKPAPKATSTVGIRGLSTEELQTASPNMEALRKLNSFKADKAAGERAAREVKLTATAVDYAPEDKGGRK